MPEVGLVQFGQVALEVAQATVPRYRTAFSKHQFTQPQLLAILCLMRYEDGTFREAEVQLAEPAELRRALQLRSVPDHTALYRSAGGSASSVLLSEIIGSSTTIPRIVRRKKSSTGLIGLGPRGVEKERNGLFVLSK
jgi:hypothetical protein